MHHWPETNESLILRVKDPADAASWSNFLSICGPVMVRMACGRGLQRADADDLAQHVFLSVAKAIEDWVPDSRKPPFIVDQNGKLHGTPVVATDVSREVQSLMTNESGPNSMQRYQLQTRENVRRVAPPFPIGRMEYYRKEHARQAESAPSGLTTMVLTWNDGELILGPMLFDDRKTGCTATNVLTHACKVSPQYL